MASTPIPTWPSTSGARNARSHTPSARSRSGPETYSIAPFMADGAYALRPGSSSSGLTSSLTGAMGDGVHRSSRSPPARNDSLFHNDWTTTNQPAMLQGIPHTYPVVSGMNSLTYDMSTNNLSYESPIRDSSPESSSSGSSNFGHTMFQYSENLMRQNASGYPMLTQPSHAPFSADDHLKAELVALRQKLREAEAETARYRFQSDWRARSEVRTKMFCSLNRAGNALCAWHDSRRERRSFPPRNAPPGYLNCGCTHEEALFEESLARHNVGSYYPGESVRMDPALRNPLLKLLQQRYGYQDGDFERNPVTGEWVRGEGAAYWEAQIQAGSSARRRGESDRH
ncbi:hypothetical protein C0991_009043 [Blastosporella zonata]|nr:hypothetical protein C0991_009043 [Blastosporella zonata]